MQKGDTHHRELWDEAAQSRDPAVLEAEASRGLQDEWERIWSRPIAFYRDKMEAAGLSASEVPPLDEIPMTTKAEMRADEDDHPPWGRFRGVSTADCVRVGTTSGTTGRTFYILFGPRDVDAAFQATVQQMWRSGLRSGDFFSRSLPVGMYASKMAGDRPAAALGVTELAVGPPAGPGDAARHIEMWELFKPALFQMTSSQLDIYIEASEQAGGKLQELFAGQGLLFMDAVAQFPEPRRRIEEQLGINLYNISGVSEIPGFYVSDCRYHTGQHIAPGHYRIQICDPETGRELPKGERGLLVVSAYGLDSFFLRYNLEDFAVEQSGPCPCGQTGQRYTLLGRAADVATVGGKRVLPIDVQLALEQAGAPEFRMTPESTDALDVSVETTLGKDQLTALLQDALDVAVRAEVLAPGTLPRSTWKQRRIRGS